MGTSSSFRGKVGNALLPNDYSEESEIDFNIEKNNIKKDKTNWTTAKTMISKYISSNGRIGTPKSIIKSYIKASGGIDKIVFGSSERKRAVVRFGNILSNVVNKGIHKTFEDIGISLENLSILEAESMLINYVHESAVSKNDIAIRSAVANAIEKLTESESNIDKLDYDEAIVFMQYFFTELIWQEMLIDFGHSIEKYMNDVENLVEAENEIKEYIKACVEESFKINKDKIFTEEMYDVIFKSSLEIIEKG